MDFKFARVRLPAGIPIGIVQGRPVYSIMGAEDAPDAQSGDKDADSTGQSAGDEEEPESNGQSADSDEKVSRTEYERIKDRLKAADRAKSEAEKRAKALEDKDKDELTKAQDHGKELEQSVQSLTSEVSKLRLENAFLRNSDFTWHDPSDVLRFVRDDDSVTIDEDGKVTGMTEALKELAKKKPYLVKTDKDAFKGQTGDPSNGGKGKGGKFDEAALRKKYKIR